MARMPSRLKPFIAERPRAQCNTHGLYSSLRTACSSSVFRRTHATIPDTDPVKQKLEIIQQAKDDPFVQKMAQGILAGDRSVLARCITLIENTRLDRQRHAQALLMSLLQTQKLKYDNEGLSAYAYRIGLTGPPGAGKSSLLETVGTFMTTQLHRKIAVLTVDPSSSTTGGSLLGDKTRMYNLARNPRAYIRPSPTGGALGGITQTTLESIILCEAAGYDHVLVETVGAGQNEYVVDEMSDVFVLVIPPAGGDELQGLKRGIVELADIILVNKADGDLLPAARRVATEYMSASKFMQHSKHRPFQWRPKVIRISAHTGEGVQRFWDTLVEYKQTSIRSGYFLQRRQDQQRKWMWRIIKQQLLRNFLANPVVQQNVPELEASVREGKLSVYQAAESLLAGFSMDTRT